MRLSVIKRMFGDRIASGMVKMQNREDVKYSLQHAWIDCICGMVST